MANFGDVVQEYYVKKFRENAAVRQKRLRSLDCRESALQYVEEVKKRIRSSYRFPAEKCPLNPRITGVVEKARFKIEKVLFDSRPGYPVTANLYIPANLTAPAPAVLFVCGHSLEGKAAGAYQSAQQSFALQGYVVLGIDPVGQGERLQYGLDSDIVVCREHNFLNRRLLPIGEDMGVWRIWDAIRAVDYMLTRSEIDPARIAVNGNSGGGTMTSLIAAVEDRIAMSCPNCYITTWMRNVENELPVDAEQIPAGCAVNGGEMADLLIAAAPRPVLIQGQKNDFFDLRGTREAYLQVKKVYELLGYGDRVEYFNGPLGHGYSVHLRENCYRFFNKHMGVAAGFESEEAAGIELLPQEELQVTPTGQVVDMPGVRTVHELIAEKVAAVKAGRKKYSKEELKEKIAAMLGVDPELPIAPYYRQLRIVDKSGTYYSRYLLETEENMRVPMFLKDLQDGYYHIPELEKVELYIPNLDAKNEMMTLTPSDGARFFGLDYRGVGETCPDGCDQPEVRDFFTAYQFDYHYASLGLLLNEPYLGGRVRDILAAISLLKQHGAREIVLRCSGIGRIPALFAAFLTDSVYAPDQALDSCEAACLDNLAPIPQSMLLKGFLELSDWDELEKMVR